MRQWTTDVLLKPGGQVANAYATGSQVVFAGQVDRIGIYLHEVTHNVDFASAFAPDGSLSGQTAFSHFYFS